MAVQVGSTLHPSGFQTLRDSRIHNQSPVLGSDANDGAIEPGGSYQAREDARVKNFLKWALLWKSIVQSSLGKTAYPYCLYIRSLDLRNFKDLLEDPLFSFASEQFFADEMSAFLNVLRTPMDQKTRQGKRYNHQRLNVLSILAMVGDSITAFVSESASQNESTVALEDLSGEISAALLPTWIACLSKLKSMTLWDGTVLSGESAKAIFENCYDFDDLTFFTCQEGADQNLSSFFGGLRKNSLRSFIALGARYVGLKTFLALSHHSTSLKRLKLDGLNSDAIGNLSLLEDCKALEMLEIQDANGVVDLEATENDVFPKFVEHLSSCNNLRELLLKNLVSGPAILTQVCLRGNVRLQKLQLVNYPLVNNQDFHRALSHQTTLESLELRADPETAFRDDIDTLISSIGQLKRLKYLNLLSTSDYFRTTEVQALASQLTNLEELWFGGYDVNDLIWKDMAKLSKLRSLNIHAVSTFSFNGILTYISLLQDTNRGLYLSIMAQLPEKAITEAHQADIREAIAATVGGSFDFTLFREQDSYSGSELFSD